MSWKDTYPEFNEGKLLALIVISAQDYNAQSTLKTMVDGGRE